jgi:hypothetical protein
MILELTVGVLCIAIGAVGALLWTHKPPSLDGQWDDPA